MSKNKVIKHIVKEGSREHVLTWDSKGVHCSEPNCEVNEYGQLVGGIVGDGFGIVTNCFSRSERSDKENKIVDGVKKKLWKMINDIDYSVEDYEYRGDEGDYTPSEQEEELINDYTQGLLEEIVNTLANRYRKLGLFTMEDIEIDVQKLRKIMVHNRDASYNLQVAYWNMDLAIADKKPIKVKK